MYDDDLLMHRYNFIKNEVNIEDDYEQFSDYQTEINNLLKSLKINDFHNSYKIIKNIKYNNKKNKDLDKDTIIYIERVYEILTKVENNNTDFNDKLDFKVIVNKLIKKYNSNEYIKKWNLDPRLKFD